MGSTGAGGGGGGGYDSVARQERLVPAPVRLAVTQGRSWGTQGAQWAARRVRRPAGPCSLLAASALARPLLASAEAVDLGGSRVASVPWSPFLASSSL